MALSRGSARVHGPGSKKFSNWKVWAPVVTAVVGLATAAVTGFYRRPIQAVPPSNTGAGLAAPSGSPTQLSPSGPQINSPSVASGELKQNGNNTFLGNLFGNLNQNNGIQFGANEDKMGEALRDALSRQREEGERQARQEKERENARRDKESAQKEARLDALQNALEAEAKKFAAKIDRFFGTNPPVVEMLSHRDSSTAGTMSAVASVEWSGAFDPYNSEPRSCRMKLVLRKSKDGHWTASDLSFYSPNEKLAELLRANMIADLGVATLNYLNRRPTQRPTTPASAGGHANTSR